MKKSELTDIIRQVVIEELKNIGPELIREALLESLSVKTSRSQEQNTSRSMMTEVAAPVVKKRVPVKFHSDPIINAIMNETEGGIPVDPSASIVEGFTPGVNTGASILDTIKSISQESLDEVPAVAAVAEVLGMDFRSKMKAVNKAVAAKKGLLT
jgi:hypothetical protein